MSAPAIGKRKRWNPPATARIDPNHPCAQGLVSLALAGGPVSGWRTLGSSPFVASASTADPTQGASEFGRSFTQTSSTNQGKVQSSAAGVQSLMAVHSPANPGSTTVAISATLGVSDIWVGTNGGKYSMAVQGSQIDGPTCTANDHAVVMLLSGNTNTGQSVLYINGVATVGGTLPTPDSTARPVYLGQYVNGGFEPGGIFVAGVAWNRPLTPADAVMLTADPFCMLVW